MERVRNIIQISFDYLVKKIIIYDLGVCVLVGLSFLIFQGFSFQAYSDRMVYAGIGIVILGGFVILGNAAVGRDFGIPDQIRRPSEAKRFLAHNLEVREALERRYDVAIQIWLIGIGCVAIGAVVQVLLAK
jgi:hypothetical protein